VTLFKAAGGHALPLDRHLAPVLTVVFVGVFVSTLLAYFQTRQTVQRLALGQTSQTLAFLDREVSSRVRDAAFHLNLWSQEDVFRLALEDSYLGLSARAAAERRLAARVGGGISARLFLIQADGAVVAASAPGMAGGVNVSDRPYFLAAMRGKPSQETYPTGRFNRQPVLVSAAPVKDLDNTVIGVLAAALEIEDFARELLQDVRIGQTGGAYIFDDAAGLLALPSWAAPGRFAPENMRAVIHEAATSDSDVRYAAQDAERMVFARRNADTGWYLVMEADADEILRPARRLASLSGVISLCTLGLVAFALGALRRAMANLRRSESSSRAITELSPVGIVTFDALQRPAYMNDQAREILGMSDAQGADLPRNIPFLAETGEPLSSTEQPVGRALETNGRVFGQIVRHAGRDGGLRTLLVNAAPLPEIGVVITLEDVTERRMAEERLRQSEEKFSQLFRLSPDSIVLTDLETQRIVDVNDTFARRTGYSREDVIGRTAEELGLFTDSSMRSVLHATLQQDGRLENAEFEVRHKDGSTAICSFSSQVLEIGDKRYMMSLVRDITEVKKMQEMMIQTEKMLSVGGIAAGIAHEINNPLGIVLQASQNIQQRMRPDFKKNVETAERIGLDMDKLHLYIQARKLDVFVEDIQSAALRASGIIRHMLDFSRRSESRRKVCDVVEIIDKAVELASSDYDLKKSYDFRKIAVVRDYDDELPVISCTETEIEQVLLNILRNAAQAMAAASPPVESPRIDIRLTGQPDRVRIEIEDNGPGVSPEVRRRIFEPFFTTKPTGIGTGLGLSVSYFIITKGHGGHLSVTSGAQGGAKFVIDLPTDQARGHKNGTH